MNSDDDAERAAPPIAVHPSDSLAVATTVNQRACRRRTRRTILTAAGLLALAGAGAVAIASYGFDTANVVADPNHQQQRGSSGTGSEVVCPGSTDGLPVDAPRLGTADIVVPGAPTTALVCRFDGVRDSAPRPLPLTQSGTIDGDPLAEVISGLNSSPAAQPMRCPHADGPASVVSFTFFYSSGAPVDVHWGSEPCAVATNGARSVQVPTISAPPYWG